MAPLWEPGVGALLGPDEGLSRELLGASGRLSSLCSLASASLVT